MRVQTACCAQRVGSCPRPAAAGLHDNAAADIRRVRARRRSPSSCHAGDLRIRPRRARAGPVRTGDSRPEAVRCAPAGGRSCCRADGAIPLPTVVVPAEHQSEVERIGLRLVSGIVRLATGFLAGLFTACLSGLRLRRGLRLLGGFLGRLVGVLLRRLLRLLLLLRLAAARTVFMRKRRGGKRSAV